MTLSPQQAYERAQKGGDSVIGWEVDRAQRQELLLQFEPRYGNVVADHVTLAAKVRKNAALPGCATAEIVGRADDGEGVEALVVSIGGTTERPDGSIYHITWSLGPGRRAKESNDVIKARGWQKLELPMPVKLAPRSWSR